MQKPGGTAGLGEGENHMQVSQQWKLTNQEEHASQEEAAAFK